MAMPEPAVFISGCHSDPDPSPGLGIARSLREAIPDAQLTGIDYSVRSSGLHADSFDRVLVQPVWAEMDLDTYSSQIRRRLDDGQTCWISGLDVEINWLAHAVGDHPRLLVPSTTAQAEVRKPRLSVASRLAMRVPPTLPADADPVELHRLGRWAGWRVWVKGVYHEALPALTFPDLGRQIERLRHNWPLEQLFVQGHVAGLERAYTFAALSGKLLGLVQVEKRAVTGQGKTWAASVTGPDAEVRARLEAFVAEVRWTGGGEVEFIRTAAGEDWLLDFNPRFPAYVHGVTLCGVNLPGRLVAAALGREPAASERAVATQFIRIVQEIPVRDDLQLPPLNPSSPEGASVGKHPSFQPELVRRLTGRPKRGSSAEAGLDDAGQNSLEAGPRGATLSPRERQPRRIDAILDRVGAAIGRIQGLPVFTPALSIKTDPDPLLAAKAAGRGWWAEVISGEELSWVLQGGFARSRVVYNGPLPADLLGGQAEPLAAVFADSVEALGRLAGRGLARVLGIRLRLPSAPSRFGIDVADYPTFSRALRILLAGEAEAPYGVHFHVAADAIGPLRWAEVAEEAMTWAGVLANALGRPPALFDLGGGWHADDFDELFLPSLGRLQAQLQRLLPGTERVVFEPGKAVAGLTAVLRATILEVRSRTEPAGATDVVVDVSIADLPVAPLYAHRMLLVRNGSPLGPLAGGSGRVLGSICMENDILAWGVSFPVPPRPGDALMIDAAGGYNASMAFPFAKGVRRDD